MTELLQFEVIDDDQPTFFAPVASDLVDTLVGQYDAMRKRIEHVGDFMSEQINSSVMSYFIEGNRDKDQGRLAISAVQMFNVEGAVQALNSGYWSKALALTDVFDAMPQKRRDEWNNSILEHKTPDFLEDTVRSTLASLLSQRTQFLAERVDGIFRGLSGEHVTNAPEAFGKRMILSRALDQYGYTNTTQFGLINDLRCVVAKFMGRDEPTYSATHSLAEILKRRWGEWMELDGGAVRIRLHRKGTAHIEVHPDMAWRLNAILANLYPMAIPASFRQRPQRRAKEHALMGSPLSFAVLAVLGNMEVAYELYEEGHRSLRRTLPNTRMFQIGGAKDKHVMSQAEDVLKSLGGVQQPWGKGTLSYWQFDFEVGPVLDHILLSGCLPEQKTHQFYATPERLAQEAVDLADIGPEDRCLEPSAGHGNLAAFLPKERTTCVEVAPLHCRILESRGFAVHEGDFIAYADQTVPRPQFDRVVMNPPFSETRWKQHIERAYQLLLPGGILVAILPAIAKSKDILDGIIEWSHKMDNQFPGTNVSVVLMKVIKPK